MSNRRQPERGSRRLHRTLISEAPQRAHVNTGVKIFNGYFDRNDLSPVAIARVEACFDHYNATEPRPRNGGFDIAPKRKPGSAVTKFEVDAQEDAKAAAKGAAAAAVAGYGFEAATIWTPNTFQTDRSTDFGIDMLRGHDLMRFVVQTGYSRDALPEEQVPRLDKLNEALHRLNVPILRLVLPGEPGEVPLPEMPQETPGSN